MQNELKIEQVSISTLKPDPMNARRHDAKNLTAISNSLKRFGQRKPIVITGDGTVVAGNGTLAAALQLGWTELACARVPRNWTHEEIKAYALADNRTAELAEWDPSMLAEQLLELDAVGWDVSDLGFLALRPDMIDEEDAFGLLHDGDRDDATQMTFTMTLRQAEILKSVIKKVKQTHSFDDSDNKNSNGNAVVTMAEEWMEHVSQRS